MGRYFDSDKKTETEIQREPKEKERKTEKEIETDRETEKLQNKVLQQRVNRSLVLNLSPHFLFTSPNLTPLCQVL